ncbi:class I SAM-dependent methyltransferase [Micromonosporaceae bacterium B7E4]
MSRNRNVISRPSSPLADGGWSSPVPRWLRLADLVGAAAVLRDAYGGRYWRHLVKVAVVPHLTITRSELLVGITAYAAPGGLRRRVVDPAIHLAWLLGTAGQESRMTGPLPWTLRRRRTDAWRVINLARGSGDPAAARLSVGFAAAVLSLADRYGVELGIEVPEQHARLRRAYQRRGFEVVRVEGRMVHLRRPARPAETSRTTHDPWVLRTGRVGLTGWQARFDRLAGPLLDVGAGDSPLAAEARDTGSYAVALDPQFGSRPPAVPGGAYVAGTAERLPFRDGSFSTISCSHSLQHVRDPVAALRECLRVTTAPGRVVVHPVWVGGRRLRALHGMPGVRVLPGRALPPGRCRASIVLQASTFDSATGLQVVAEAVRPRLLVRTAGRVAMRILIAVCRTTSIGPGARR